MAINPDLIIRLRNILGDIDPVSPMYTDGQMSTFVAVAATQVLSDMVQWWNTFTGTFGGSFAVNVVTPDIQPDPFGVSPNGFANLIILRAGCLIMRGEARAAAAKGGWKVTDDRSTIDGAEFVKGAKLLADGFCSAYDRAVDEFGHGNAANAGQSILGPYASANGPRGGTWSTYWGGFSDYTGSY